MLQMINFLLSTTVHCFDIVKWWR